MFRNILISILVIAAVGSVYPDTVKLKNGKTFTDVRVQESGQNVYVISRDGSMEFLNRDAIVSVEKKSVNWKRKKRGGERERMRRYISRIERKLSRKTLTVDSRWSLVWCSALVPGWGFVYADENWTGITQGLIFFAGASLASSQSKAYAAAQAANTENSGSVVLALIAPTLSGPGGGDGTPLIFLMVRGNEAKIKEDSTKASSVNATAFVGGFYIYQMLHAYIFGASIEKGETAHRGVPAGPPVRISFCPGAGRERAAVVYRGRTSPVA